MLGERSEMKLNVRGGGSPNNERMEQVSFEIVRLHLQAAFAAPDEEYETLSADDIRRRAVADAARRLRESTSEP